MNGGDVIFKFKGDETQLDKSMQNVTKKTNNFAGGVVKAMAGIGTATAITSFAGKSLKLASDLQEVQNVVDTTFKSSSAVINKFAEDAGEAYGISTLNAKKFNGTMGAMLKSMGLSESTVTDMSMAMTGLTGDMASFYNLDHQEAFDKLRSGISGETEPLKQLGINMSVANLEAYALAKGIKKSYKDMTQAEQATLRYNYIMKATADAQGDFAKTSNSFANQQRLAALRVEELSAKLGQKLLPIGVKVLEYFMKALTKLEKDIIPALKPILKDVFEIIKAGADLVIPVIKTVIDFFYGWYKGIKEGNPVITALSIVLGTIVGIFVVFNTVMAIATAVTTAFGAVMAIVTSPLFLIALAIGAVVAAGYLIVKNWDTIKDAVGQGAVWVWNKVKWLAGVIFDVFFGWPKKMFSVGVDLIKGLWNGIANFDLIGKVKNIAKDVLKGFKGIFGIKSPSREMFKIGGYVDQGFIKGIESMDSDINKSFASMFNLSPQLYGTSSQHFSPTITVNNVNNIKQDPLGQMVNNVKSFSGGSKNSYNYGGAN